MYQPPDINLFLACTKCITRSCQECQDLTKIAENSQSTFQNAPKNVDQHLAENGEILPMMPISCQDLTTD